MSVPLTTHTQDSAYSSPWTFGMKVRMQIWAYAWALLCEWTPKPLNPWRLVVLRVFGATVEGKPFVHQRMRVHIPWNLVLRDRATVGDRANLYNMAVIEIGARAIVAQETYLCTGTHDFDDPHLPLQTAPIRVGEDAFVSARVFVMPGVSIGARSIVGAASVVTRDVPPDVLAAGNPCRVIKARSRAVARCKIQGSSFREGSTSKVQDSDSRMKVLVWGVNYAPEATGIAPYNVALCEYLQSKGHEARMLTAFAYYPEWRKRAEDRGKWYRTDTARGVPVQRCWHYVPEKVSALKRIVHEGTFVACSFLRGLALPKPDVMVVVSPPLLLGAAAWALGKVRGVPFVFYVQDLQPDAAVGLGMLKVGLFTKMLYQLEAFAYAKAARVVGICQGMLRAFARKGVPEEKRVLFPNGVQVTGGAERPAAGLWRARQGFGAGDFLAVYSGNLGVKQGLDVLVGAAALVKDARVRIVICGQGATQEKLAAEVARRELANLRLLPLQDDEAYREMMVDADVCVITQQAGTGQFFFPSKLLSALAFAKPVLAVADADSELALALDEGGFGMRVLPERPGELAAALDRAAGLAAGELRRMAEAGRRFGERFEMGKVLADFEVVLRRVKEERG